MFRSHFPTSIVRSRPMDIITMKKQRLFYNKWMEASSAGVEELQFGSRGLGGKFWTLIGATFLAFLGIGTVLPGMALHVRHDLGGSDRTVGFVIGTFSVVALGSRVISGPLTDRRGRK